MLDARGFLSHHRLVSGPNEHVDDDAGDIGVDAFVKEIGGGFIPRPGPWRCGDAGDVFKRLIRAEAHDEMGDRGGKTPKAPLSHEGSSHTANRPRSPMHGPVPPQGPRVRSSKLKETTGRSGRHVGVRSARDTLLQVLAECHDRRSDCASHQSLDYCPDQHGGTIHARATLHLRVSRYPHRPWGRYGGPQRPFKRQIESSLVHLGLDSCQVWVHCKSSVIN